ncbi:hypothetical protein ACVWYG_001431 [Pedobacter sp. UYEF25]
MKSKFTAFSPLLFALFSISASAQQSVPDSANMVTLRIDPANAKGGKVSDVFSEVEFIPLETTKESLFGEIENLHVIDGNFVFSDVDTKAVYIYDAKGNFKSKIDAHKLKVVGAKNTQYINFDIEVVTIGARKAIQISVRRDLFIFDLDGKLLKRAIDPEQPINGFRQVKFNSPKDFVGFYVVDEATPDTALYELATFKNNKKTGQYFPVNLKDSLPYTFVRTHAGPFYYGAENEFFFSRKQDYNLYLAKPEALSIAYRFVFPKAKTLPKDFRTSEKYRNNAIQWLSNNSEVIYGIGNTYLLDNNLFFKAESLEGKNSFIYNLKDNQLTSIEDLQADSISQFFPITDARIGRDFQRKGLQTFENGNFYTSYSSLAFFDLMEQNEGKLLKNNPRLAKFFKEGNRKSNPIILRLKPKNN